MVELAKKKIGKTKRRDFGDKSKNILKSKKKKILTTNINVIEVIPKKKLNVRYFNCNKKSYYANNYIKPLKN